METVSQVPFRGTKVQAEEPDRNIWCPEYDACLSKAALYDLPLSCRECPMSTMQTPVFVLTLCEIEGCKALVNAIFKSGGTVF